MIILCNIDSSNDYAELTPFHELVDRLHQTSLYAVLLYLYDFKRSLKTLNYLLAVCQKIIFWSLISFLNDTVP